jgi:hypothetical protein
MTVQITGRELDEIVRELYVLPPTDFVAARNELVRRARAAGSRDVAERLQQLRRPTRSAWLVNVLARDPVAMQRLSALGRQLRDAQTALARDDLRNLAEQRRHLIADLMDRIRAHAAESDIRLTPTVLSEVEATLQAALVDLAGAMTVRNGRLVRPLTHSGFGPRPRSSTRHIEAAELQPVELRPAVAGEIREAPIEDELAARRQRGTARRTVELVPVAERSLIEEELAAAETAHWQSEFELADAEAAVDAADDMVSTLDTKRIEARRDRVTAQRYLAEAQSRQRDAVKVLAEARRRLDAARRLAGKED